MKVLVLAATAAIATAAAAAEIAPEDRRSGYDFAGAETRAMQDDDTANPGMLGVLQGETLWAAKAGAADKSCADCHGEARASMKGVAARYPMFEPDARPPARSRSADQPVPQRASGCCSHSRRKAPTSSR